MIHEEYYIGVLCFLMQLASDFFAKHIEKISEI